MSSLRKIKNLIGIEREALRVCADGKLSKHSHPIALGHKLTNSSITVDFSETLLEIITKPHHNIDATLVELTELSAFTLQNISSEDIILNTSMPLSADSKDIHEADFGVSNSGQMKHIYRKGLSNRYGKAMQIISGIHYNFSIDEDLVKDKANKLGISTSDVYFGVINNYFKCMFLLPYLFGASPICAKTSINTKPDYLDVLDEEFYIGKYSTSLRMSDLGYTSPAQQDLQISYLNVADYAQDIIAATEKPLDEYAGIPYKSDNQINQLNKNILQIENEYYSHIRPKQVAKRCERPASALLNRGVEYIEVRVLDVDPFSKNGISKDSALFVEAMLMSCFSDDFEDYNKDEQKIFKDNFTEVAMYGRKPNLLLKDVGGNDVSFAELSMRYLDNIDKVARELGDEYVKAVSIQIEKIQDVTKTPSDRVVQNAHKNGYKNFALDISNKITNEFRSYNLAENRVNDFRKQATDSIAAEKELSSCNKLSIEDYIARYYKS